MQSDVLALVVGDLYGDFRLGLAFRGFNVGLDDVILRAGRHTLRELAPAVGRQFPFRFFGGGRADLDGNSRHWAIVRTPDGTNNQRVVLGRTLLRGRRREKRQCQ